MDTNHKENSLLLSQTIKAKNINRKGVWADREADFTGGG
jgi:hypothetical protein